jgi:hypothetical protein
MKSKLILVFAVLATAAALVPFASATTAPTLTIKIRVTMSDTGVKLSQVKSYRGWYANFIVVNHGKKAHKFEIGGMTTPVLKPGKSHVIKVELALRGTVTYKDLLNPGSGSTGTFTVV